jgi:hypothetical protein
MMPSVGNEEPATRHAAPTPADFKVHGMTFPAGKPMALPPELEGVREAARRAVFPIKAADASTKADQKLLFNATRINAGRRLPPYYLVYFLFVDLLGYPNLGQFEKVAWSVPIDFQGIAFLIEHRKFGLGVFGHEVEDTERQATRIVTLVNKGVAVAKPFFRWMAENAVQASKLNVRNIGIKLFKRYTFFRDQFRSITAEAQILKHEQNAERRQYEFRLHLHSTRLPKSIPWLELAATFTSPWIKKSEDASWLALAAIEAFFGWTEHIFIHLAVLQGHVTTGAEVADMARSDWGDKFKRAFDVRDKNTKKQFDILITIRRQLRNFIAHGAFGKEGEAFNFHSGAGAAPVAFDYKRFRPQFSLSPELAFDDEEAIAAIETFIAFMWSGAREPARIYIQESGLPLILPHASDGVYLAAMASLKDMTEYVDHLAGEWDRAGDMDW